MTDNQEKDELPLGITLAEGKPNDSPSHPTERDREGSDSSHNSGNPDIPEGTKYPPSHHQYTSDTQATVAATHLIDRTLYSPPRERQNLKNLPHNFNS